MCSTLRIVVGPSAKRATAESVCTVSLMAFMSNVDPAKSAAGPLVRSESYRDALRCFTHVTAHRPQAVAKGHVALQAVARQALDGDAASGNGRRGEEVARRRGVGLDRVSPPAIRLRRGNMQWKIVASYRRAEGPHDSQGHGDVRLGN